MGAEQGNGVKIPAFNQYRGHREADPLAKASHWGNLRRQDLFSSEVRVGRTAVIDGIFAKMVMVMFCLSGAYAIAFFLFYGEKFNIWFPWPGTSEVECLAEQENGVQVPTLPAL